MAMSVSHIICLCVKARSRRLRAPCSRVIMRTYYNSR